MNRFLILGCLGLLCQPLRGQEVASTNAAAPLRANHRFLFLIDTSSAMSGQKDLTLDSVSRLILSGVGGRIQRGDVWSLWTLDDQLHTDVFPTPGWDPQQRGDFANRIFRVLRDQHFKKKKMPLEQVMAAVAEEAKFSGILTVFLFTDGSAPVNGTPFDESINGIFAKHAAGMKKAKKPFVTVLVTQDGKFAAHAVSPGGERIYIPPLPEDLAKAKKTEAPAKEKADPVVPSPPKTLTVDEISELLLQSQKRQSNTVAIAPAPLILRGNASQTNPVAAETAAKPTVETSAPPPLAAVPAPAPTPPPTASVPTPNPTVSTDQSATLSTPPAAIAQAAPVRIEPGPPTEKNASASGDAIGPSPSEKDRPLASTTETSVSDTGESPVRSPGSAQTAVLGQQEPVSDAPMYLMAAVALLLSALILGWLYIRNIRYVPRPSIISQSLDRQKK